MKRILVALRSMVMDETAFSRARQLAAAHCASLSLVHVPTTTVPINTLHLLRDELWREAVAKLGDRAPEFHLEVEVAEGYPTDVILAVAENPVPDLVVLGDHQGLRIRDRIFGTTGTRVVRDARCPVLIARKRSLRPYERVMAAIDDIASAEQIIATACSVGAVKHLALVHVAGGADETAAHLLAEPTTMYRRSLEEHVAALSQRHAGMKVTIEIAPAPEGALSHLVAQWNQLSPDLLVMGTRERNPLARWFTASFAETALLECTSDVLVVPNP